MAPALEPPRVGSHAAAHWLQHRFADPVSVFAARGRKDNANSACAPTMASAAAADFSVIIRQASARRRDVGSSAIAHNIGSRQASTVAVAKASWNGSDFLPITA